MQQAFFKKHNIFTDPIFWAVVYDYVFLRLDKCGQMFVT